MKIFGVENNKLKHMKKISIFILAIVSIVALSSCEKDQKFPEDLPIETAKVNSVTALFTYLDASTTVNTVFTRSAITNVVVTLKDGTKLYEGNINDDFTIDFDVTEKQFLDNHDGAYLDLYYELSIKNTTKTFKFDKWIKRNCAISPVLGNKKFPFKVYEQSSLVDKIYYSVVTNGTKLDKVTAQYKIGEDGDYKDFSTAFSSTQINDSLLVKGSDAYWSANDEVFVKFIAIAGTRTDVSEVSFVVAKNTIAKATAMDLLPKLSLTDLKGYSLKDKEEVLIASNSCHIRYTGDITNVNTPQEITALNGIKFVELTGDYKNESSIVTLKNIYEAGVAGAITSIVNPLIGQTYVTYFTDKVGTDDVNFVGVLTITGRNISDNPEANHIAFDYAVSKYNLVK